jgi:hypothetical protein
MRILPTVSVSAHASATIASNTNTRISRSANGESGVEWVVKTKEARVHWQNGVHAAHSATSLSLALHHGITPSTKLKQITHTAFDRSSPAHSKPYLTHPPCLYDNRLLDVRLHRQWAILRARSHHQRARSRDCLPSVASTCRSRLKTRLYASGSTHKTAVENGPVV